MKTTENLIQPSSVEKHSYSLPRANSFFLHEDWVYVFIVAIFGALLTGKPVKSSITVFPVVYLLTIVALMIAGNATIRGLNLEAVIFSLSIGLIIGNLFRLPEWFSAALSTELYVKVGLVLLGTGVIFSDIL